MPVNISTCRIFTFYKTAFVYKNSFSHIFFHFIFLSIGFAQRHKIDSLQKILPAR
jgi:hypothetical protein